MAVQELFRANKRESTVDIVVNNIKKLLIERKLKPGDRLPNEVEISEAMNVSRGSVREALRILTAFGLVESRVGTGTYICQKPGRTLADSLLFSFFVNNPNIGKLYEFRRLIEIDILESVLDHYDENEEERRMLEEEIPLGRMGSPEEVAAAIAFLAGEDARYFTGQVLSPNGGIVI